MVYRITIKRRGFEEVYLAEPGHHEMFTRDVDRYARRYPDLDGANGDLRLLSPWLRPYAYVEPW